MNFGSGTTTTYGYDPNNLRLTSLVTSGNVQNFAYEYDSVGNIKKITDASFAPARISNFTYDDLNRLTRWELVAIYDQDFTYTPIGNLIERKDVGVPQAFGYTDSAHKHAVTQHNGITQFVYDANGNMIQRYDNTLAFDAENRLTTVTGPSATTTYVYDGDGARVKRSANGVTTYYIGNHYEVTVSGTTSVLKYYYFGAQRVAMRNSSGLVYLHSDHLGSTSVTSGAVSSKQTYYPYGANFATTGTPPTDFGFTGQRRDASAGLMYYGARYYDAGLGRFISADTMVPNQYYPQDLNRYTYARNNPLKYTDPSGHCAIIGCILIAVLIGGALTVAWLPNAQTANAPADANLAIEDPDPHYGDKAFLDSAPGTGDISDIYAVGAGQRLFTGEEQNRLEATAFALAPLITGGIIKQVFKNADIRVAKWGIQGTIGAAEQGAKKGIPILPGVFKYGNEMKSINNYQRHHLWPRGLGGPEDGWAVYVKSTGNQNWHTAEGGIQEWLNKLLIEKHGFADYAELKQWSLQNPDRLLNDLRDIYSGIGVDFPY